MSKGDNPNSRANLEKGKATRFRKGDTQGKREAAIASNKAQAKLKTLKQWIEFVGGLKVNGEIAKKMSAIFPDIEPKELTNLGALGLRLFNDAITRGDKKAIEQISSLRGEKVERQEIVANISNDIDIEKIKELKKVIDKE